MYLLSLSHVAEQNTPHALDCTLLHLVGAPLVITNLPTDGRDIPTHNARYNPRLKFCSTSIIPRS